MMSTRRVMSVVLGLALAGWFVVGASAAPAMASAEATGEHGEAAGRPDLNPMSWDSDLAIWTAVIFLSLLAVLWKFAWKPIADGLDKREQGIADDISAAEKANADAKELLVQYQQKLADSQEEVRQMIEAGKRDAEKAGQAIIDKSREAAAAERERAIAEIDVATAGALQELAQRSADLAVSLAGKIVTARLDKADHTRLIEQAVADFAKVDPGNN